MQTCRDLIDGTICLNEDQLSHLMNQRRGPLGRYFETLVQIVISLSPYVVAFYPNIVIHNGERTCGELDLVYKTPERWIHLEVAVKYYIGIDDRHDQFQWYGPAGRDTLGRKLKHMFKHQLELPHTEDARPALDKLGIDVVYSEALVMGMLFHPFANWQKEDIQTPPIVVENYPAGWWLPLNELHKLNEHSESSWKILSKPEWLSPIEPSYENTLNINAFQQKLKSEFPSHPVMVAAFNDGVESHRGFVVADDWMGKINKPI